MTPNIRATKVNNKVSGSGERNKLVVDFGERNAVSTAGSVERYVFQRKKIQRESRQDEDTVYM